MSLMESRGLCSKWKINSLGGSLGSQRLATPPVNYNVSDSCEEQGHSLYCFQTQFIEGKLLITLKQLSKLKRDNLKSKSLSFTSLVSMVVLLPAFACFPTSLVSLTCKVQPLKSCHVCLVP